MESGAQQRRSFILSEVGRARTVRITDLSRQLGVSEVLIRRDLVRLQQQGLLKRVHGGAVALPQAAIAGSLGARAAEHALELDRIGRAAAELICPGDRLIFDSGATCLQVARHIPGDLLTRGQLTVITSSLPVVYELGGWKSLHLLLLGGIYLPDAQVVVGPQAIENLSGLHADKLFAGSDGMTLSHGLGSANMLEAEVERAMVRAASQVIAVADSSKIGRIGLATAVPLDQIHVLVTDRGASPEFVSDLRARGVQVVLA